MACTALFKALGHNQAMRRSISGACSERPIQRRATEHCLKALTHCRALKGPNTSMKGHYMDRMMREDPLAQAKTTADAGDRATSTPAATSPQQSLHLPKTSTCPTMASDIEVGCKMPWAPQWKASQSRMAQKPSATCRQLQPGDLSGGRKRHERYVAAVHQILPHFLTRLSGHVRSSVCAEAAMPT